MSALDWQLLELSTAHVRQTLESSAKTVAGKWFELWAALELTEFDQAAAAHEATAHRRTAPKGTWS